MGRGYALGFGCGHPLVTQSAPPRVSGVDPSQGPQLCLAQPALSGGSAELVSARPVQEYPEPPRRPGWPSASSSSRRGPRALRCSALRPSSRHRSPAAWPRSDPWMRKAALPLRESRDSDGCPQNVARGGLSAGGICSTTSSFRRGEATTRSGDEERAIAPTWVNTLLLL
ncbi:hypothetical protein GW7_12261 [Heterocephalus glaber]|uniref:Uncharacterized protein n=1 Tax=Heterocephalus glaber TaxID=10181 RepID=G5C322_HETGA|nr:hypothetical protein GW7_12261 [Heterocephalus glaber]